MMIEAPENEIIWLQRVSDGVVTHVITSDLIRSVYYLYKVDKGKLKKTRHQNADPTELERKIK